jgi:hypothetical protein
MEDSRPQTERDGRQQTNTTYSRQQTRDQDSGQQTKTVDRRPRQEVKDSRLRNEMEDRDDMGYCRQQTKTETTDGE